MRVRGTPVVPLGGADLDSEDERGTNGEDIIWTPGDVAVFSVTEKNKAEGGMFVDASAMKEKLRLSLLKPKYNVHDFYHNEGFFQRVGKDPLFENVTLAVIGLNAFWIWIDTDYNDAESIDKAEPPFVIVENIFCVFFSTELFIRFLAFKHKCNCLRDAWFGFDSCLVATMVIETWVLLIVKLVLGSSGGEGMSNVSMLRMFRLLRLSRMARMARLFRAMPELLILVKGMVAATRSVFFVCFMLVIIMYVFAIAFKQLSHGTESVGEDLFPTVPKAMLTLLLHGALMDEFSGIIYTLEDESPVCMVLFMAFILLAALTVMNMLIGVLCEVISAVAEQEKESMMVDKVHEKFESIVRELDKNCDGTLSWTEFEDIMQLPEAISALESVNVDPATMVEMAEDVFWDDQGQEPGESVPVSFEEFMAMVLNLRGGQQATVENIMSTAKRFNRKFLVMNNRLDLTNTKIKGLNGSLGELLDRRGIRAPSKKSEK